MRVSASNTPSPPPVPAPAIPPVPTAPPRSAGHRQGHQWVSPPQTPAPPIPRAPPRQIADGAESSQTLLPQSSLFQYVRAGPLVRPEGFLNRLHESPARSPAQSRRQSARSLKPTRLRS